MPIPKKVEDYLNKANKAFETVSHKTVYTAYDLAKTLKKDLKSIAKALLVRADNEYVIVVLPSSSRINLQKLKTALKAKKVTIPGEKVMKEAFKVKPGAITAFGGLHKVKTVVDKGLIKTKDVIVQAGSFTDSVRIKVKDFIDMEEAAILNFAEKAKYKVPKVVVAKRKKTAGKNKKRAVPKKSAKPKKKTARAKAKKNT